MATFSENQVRHLYVGVASGAVSADSAVGTIKAMADKDHKTVWFKYMSPAGVVSSDKIKVANIVKVTARKSTTMEKPLNRTKVVLKGGKVVAGQDYLLRVVFRQFIGMSDEDLYFKYGMVHGVAGMTADTFYKTLAISLAKNIAREDNKLLKIYAHSATATAGKFGADHLTEVTAMHTVSGGTEGRTNNWDDGSKTVTDIDYILLEEVEQPWILGRVSAGKIPFDVQPDTIVEEGDEFIWGEVTKEAPKNKITNGKEIADLEYFCMGERGDLYRNVGWPYVIDTKYLVDPKHNYDVLDITYFYAGPNEDVQKSQKTITIVADNASANKVIKAIITDFNAATANKPEAVVLPE